MPFVKIAQKNEREVRYWASTEAEAKRSVLNCPNMTEGERRKLIRIMDVFFETGRFRFNKEKFKSVEGESDLFVLKAHQLRAFGTYLDPKVFGICYCVRKKKNKHRPEDIKNAQMCKANMKEEWGNGQH
ncbi:hypothetical protein [Desulfolutivibrio sulfoxidireducens]|uniref:hypothetical protein n=1 Tax=Desulfolutivibrio sulfoxidireducens TaxID=2773299 RepID=UPI00159D161D|nr:hypothetical protein [Desulfolutivibrio sulfoxidireducens]QLA17565.1 hypothetical protein GD605_16500 [Desulfolutivibrio sulfoxidireducens]